MERDVSSPTNASGADPVTSPFFGVEATLAVERKSPRRLRIWILAGAIATIVGLLAGYFVAKHLRDPLRTLEQFPVAKYLDNHRAVAGSRFRGELSVEADLGWKEGVGRLMVFSTRGEPRPLVVMIPAHLAQIYFTKGQTYLAELEVKDGGLIYANSCRKN